MPQIKVLSPYDQSHLRSFDLMDANEIEKKLSTAYALTRGSPLPTPKRIEILEKAAHLIESKAEEYAMTVAQEGGKPLVDARVEIARAAQGTREAATSIAHMVGRRIPMGLNNSSLHRLAYTQREPIGVVVSVSAFNHPFNLIVHQVMPAVAVGSPVIVKPALSTPISCTQVLKVLYEAGLPEEWAQLALCDNDVSEKLVTDPRVAFFSFIGSSKVGWTLRSKLAPGTRCALEHGGAAPVIFDEDADIQSALPLLVKGGFYHAGQVCVSVQRVFVHKKIVDEVAEGLVRLTQKLSVGDPSEEKTEVGPLILEREVDRVATWVQEAKDQGAQILCGGEKRGNTCFAPTILLNPSQKSQVSQKEIFGPVINIYSYDHRREAIEWANSLPFSFQASVFTKSLDVALDTIHRLEAAAVMVNDHTAFRVDWMPFAGHKQSGLGVGGIAPTMEEMTQEKLVIYKSNFLA